MSISSFAAVAITLMGFVAQPTVASSGCLSDPRTAAAAFQDSWNRHDMEEFANLFWEDATFVARGGRLSVGREEIKSAHFAIHAAHLRDSRLENRIEHFAFLGDDVAVALVRSDLSGNERAAEQTVRTRLTVVLHRRACGWRIAAAQNTTLAETR